MNKLTLLLERLGLSKKAADPLLNAQWPDYKNYRVIMTMVDGHTVVRETRATEPAYAADRFLNTLFEEVHPENPTVYYPAKSIVKLSVQEILNVNKA